MKTHMIGKAWQRIVRERAVDQAELFSGVIELSSCSVVEIKAESAKMLIEQYEWLGKMAPFPWKCFGLVAPGGKIVGVVEFVRRRNGNRLYSIEGRSACALVRGAVIHSSPPNANSKLVQEAVSLVAKMPEAPAVALAYVDSAAGEVGTIYQACGWNFLGWSPAIAWTSPDGRRFNASHHRNLAWRRFVNESGKVDKTDVDRMMASMLGAGWKRERYGLRGRYARAVSPRSSNGRKIVHWLRGKSKPYPKRAGEASMVTCGTIRC